MKISIIQMNSTLNYQDNLDFIHKSITDSIAENPDLKAVFLPEVFYSMSDGTKPTPYLVIGENEHFKNIQNIAITHNVYLLGGTAATKINESDDKVLNRAYNFSPKGELLSTYDKIHLFSVIIKGEHKSLVIDESQVYSAGKSTTVTDIEGFKLGTSICFDLRFPELYRNYFTQGVNLITIASAFTIPTGQAHWETLVRARAIENQSYIVAVNQCGEHNEKIKTYGHSMVVDPWGTIIAELKEEVGYAVCELKHSQIAKIRGRMDVGVRVKFSR